MEKKYFEKQIIVRIYGAPLDKLKASVRALNAMEGVTPELFGKDNEFLVSLTVKRGGEAAATELCELAAASIEKALGDDAYGRGAYSLAHIAAGELIKISAQLCSASEELGLLLEEEFKTTKRAEHIFDFGEYSYRKPTQKPLKARAKTIEENGEASIAVASELAMRARKAASVRYGAALTVADADGRRWIAVADKQQTYARQMQAGETSRAAALAVLDFVRRLAANPTPQSTSLPLRQKADKNATKRANKIAIFAAAASLAFSLLTAGGIYYIYDKYYIPQEPDMLVLQAFK